MCFISQICCVFILMKTINSQRDCFSCRLVFDRPKPKLFTITAFYLFFPLFIPALFKDKTITDSIQNNLWLGTKQIKCEISSLCFVWLYNRFTFCVSITRRNEQWRAVWKELGFRETLTPLLFSALLPYLLLMPSFFALIHTLTIFLFSSLCHLSPIFLSFFFYFFHLFLSLRHAHTQTWHTFEQSIPLLNNTSFISVGLFSLACFKQRGEMGF